MGAGAQEVGVRNLLLNLPPLPPEADARLGGEPDHERFSRMFGEMTVRLAQAEGRLARLEKALPNPNKIAKPKAPARSPKHEATLSGLLGSSAVTPRVVAREPRARRPWAGMSNPVGVESGQTMAARVRTDGQARVANPAPTAATTSTGTTSNLYFYTYLDGSTPPVMAFNFIIAPDADTAISMLPAEAAGITTTGGITCEGPARVVAGIPIGVLQP